MQMQNFKNKPVIMGIIMTSVLTVAALPSLAHGQNNNHPMFVTIERIEEVVAEAVSGLEYNLDQLVSRLNANDAVDANQDSAIAALEQQVSDQQALMASQSAQLAQIHQAITDSETRVNQLEAVSHEKTPIGETMFLNGHLTNGQESIAVDLTDYDVVTFRVEAVAGHGRFIVYRNDSQHGWLPVKIMESDVLTSSRVNYTMLLEDGEYKVVVDHSNGFLGNFTAVHY